MLLKSLFRYWTYQIIAPGALLREKYEAFKALLENDKRAHEWMAELEEIHHGGREVDLAVVASLYEKLSAAVGEIVANLQRMTPSRHLDLKDYYRKFDFYVRFMLDEGEIDFSPPFVRSLSEIDEDSLSSVGGKAAHLASIGRSSGLPMPEGFAVTTSAFNYFLEFNDLKGVISRVLGELDPRDTVALDRASVELMQAIRFASVPPCVESAISEAYQSCFSARNHAPSVAVRSSAVGEDGRASFAGQYKTVLNVERARIADAYKEVIASKYSPEALFYRISCGISDLDTPMAVLILEMVDAVASGVIYTRSVEHPDPELLEIHATWGLGEILVQGEVSPDVFRVRKESPPTIVERRIGRKPMRMGLDPSGETVIEEVTGEALEALCLEDRDCLTLAEWGMRLEAVAGEAQDIEWCLNRDGSLFLLQTRSLGSEPVEPSFEVPSVEEVAGVVLLEAGDRAAAGAGAGEVFVVRRDADLDHVPDDAVLVARNASSHYVKVLGKLSAVVTDMGSPAGHFASVAREFHIPVLVNTGVATEKLETGRVVTVYADAHRVYDGVIPSLAESSHRGRGEFQDSTFARKLAYVIGFVSPLKLIDPEREDFIASGCRSMHDIIRFAHETAIREMFTIGDRKTGRKMGAKKFVSPIPMLIYLLDVGGGLAKDVLARKEIGPDDIASKPFQSVFAGLSHPDIQWSGFTHFNWEEYDRIVMSGGIISAESAQLASYAVLSAEYLNLNLKFGYHYVILDTVCSDRPEENHILFRFTGGGGDLHGRSLRAEFLCLVLERMGFEVGKTSDLVDARYQEAPEEAIAEKLDLLGRLLGATRLMDMYLKEEGQVEGFVEDFMQGRYHFSSVAMDE
jgi:pyruvate, water dikinase